jgi:hypothetical protein
MELMELIVQYDRISTQLGQVTKEKNSTGYINLTGFHSVVTQYEKATLFVKCC